MALAAIEPAGFAATAIGIVVNGGIIGGIVGGITSGTLKGIALGALQGALFAEAGNIVDPIDGSASAYLGSHTLDVLVSHGLVGGLVSVVGGGNFGSGFLAAGIGSFAPSPVANETLDETAEGAAESAVLGGVGSLLGGGKFLNGAETGAFGYLFNAELHKNNESDFDKIASEQLEALSRIPRDIWGLTKEILDDPLFGLSDLSNGLAPVAPALSEFSIMGQGAGAASEVEGAFSTWDTSITSSGSKFLNIQTDVSATEFQANLEVNGYNVVSQTGGRTILSNGTSTYTIYSRTSTGLPGAQYFGPNGSSVKYSLGGP